MNTVLRKSIDWVGHVDWTVQDFHGYQTLSGSSYNAYLVRDQKTALIDTVKAPFVGHLLARVAALTDLSKVDYVVCNHAEPDHSGGLPSVMKAIPGAELVCNTNCREALACHYDTSKWKVRIVSDGSSLSLGSRTLTFLNTPMVHWPESMFTYVPEEKLLFSMDAFGQHYASATRFDEDSPLDAVMAEAKTYYANIVMLYGGPISRVLDRAKALPIEVIAPSHGVIWREYVPTILAAYRKWVTCRPVAKVLIVYDTMWKSTELMAQAIHEGALERPVDARLISIRASHITEIATQTLDAAALAVGSPTLNGVLMPEVAAALTYLKGLRPTGKAGFAFGSYGWAKGGQKDVDEYLQAMKFDMLREPLSVRYVPGRDALDECRAAGRDLADAALKKVEAAVSDKPSGDAGV